MIVPTLTMLGRSWCPCSREAGIAVAVATGSLCRYAAGMAHPDPLGGSRPTSYSRQRARVRAVHVGAGDRQEALPRFTLGRVFTEWELDARC